MSKGGIRADQSRFSALKIDDVSDDEEAFTVVKSARQTKAAQPQKTAAFQPATVKASAAPTMAVSKAASKNAKRRAKKKNEQEKSDCPSEGASTLAPIADDGGGAPPSAHGGRRTAAAEEQYKRDLDLAIAQSTRDKELYDIAHVTQPHPQQQQPVLHGHDATASLAMASSNGFELTADPSGRLPAAATNGAAAMPEKKAKKKKAATTTDTASGAAAAAAAAAAAPPGADLQEAAQLCREEQRKTSMFKQLQLPNDLESVRIAELTDLLERKDKSLKKIIKLARKMEVDLTAAKERNKQLCQIMSQGEMSEKGDLVEQLNELTVQNKELNEQVTDLHSQLEQEKSKSKSQRSSKKG